jgi:hypothetical protein
MQSDYMHWAKYQAPVRYSLSSSEVPHFRLDSLPLVIADLDLDGASHPRFAPLRQAIAERYGVTAEMVVTANGTSMANFLAMAALVAPGDEVISNSPLTNRCSLRPASSEPASHGSSDGRRKAFGWTLTSFAKLRATARG